MNRQDRNLMKVFARYLPLATLLPAAVFVGYIMGYLLDKWLETHFLYIVFLFLGMVAGLLQLVRELNKLDNGR